MAKYLLRVPEANRSIFNAVRTGRKRMETRAATERYRRIKEGDMVRFVCGKDSFEREVKGIKRYRTVSAMLKVHKVNEIVPTLTTRKELEDLYKTFTGYKEKIRRFGLVAIEL